MFTDAIFAGLRTRLSAFAGPVLRLPLRVSGGHISGPVTGAGTPRKPVGEALRQAKPVNLKARALRLYNRSDKAASAYERVHTILGAGRADH